MKIIVLKEGHLDTFAACLKMLKTVLNFLNSESSD